MPKLDGNRVALRGRVTPERHARATAAAHEHDLSLSNYLGGLIDRDTLGGDQPAPRTTVALLDIPVGGKRVALRGRVAPETHARGTEAAHEHGMTLNDYLAWLIDRDTLGEQKPPSTRALTLFGAGEAISAAA